MQDTWQILRWSWAAVCVVYGVLQIIGSMRLRGMAKKRSRNILVVMVILVAMQSWIREVLGNLQAIRWAAVFVGIAAAVAALFLATMLIRQKDDRADDAQDTEEHIQSLKSS